MQRRGVLRVCWWWCDCDGDYELDECAPMYGDADGVAHNTAKGADVATAGDTDFVTSAAAAAAARLTICGDAIAAGPDRQCLVAYVRVSHRQRR